MFYWSIWIIIVIMRMVLYLVQFLSHAILCLQRVRGSSSEGSRTPGRPGAGDHRLMRSASATAVPSTQRPGTRRTPAGGQEPGRCHTPPASLSRPRTHTPPPTRASTLRAQARQVAIQRSQSARTVADRPRRVRPVSIVAIFDTYLFYLVKKLWEASKFADHITGIKYS